MKHVKQIIETKNVIHVLHYVIKRLFEIPPKSNLLLNISDLRLMLISIDLNRFHWNVYCVSVKKNQTEEFRKDKVV